MHYIRTLLHKFVSLLRAHPKKSAALVCAAIALFILFTSYSASAPQNVATDTGEKSVTLASVATLSEDGGSLMLLGEVRSVSQAELHAQKGGEVTRVNVRSGQYVAPGTILVEIENQSERATVLQAQAGLKAAEAAFAKVRAGARSEDRASASAQTTNAAVALATTKESARTAYSQAYSLAQDALFVKADTFFTNAYTVRPSFRVRSATYDERTAIEQERVALGELLDGWGKRAVSTIADHDLEQSLMDAQDNLERLKAFLDRISTFIAKQELTNDYTEALRAADTTVILAARASVDSARSGVSGARGSLASAQTSEYVTSLSESKIATGDRPEDVAAVLAGVAAARASLLGAEALLENTYIRTPIGGTVSTLSISRGEFVSNQQPIAIVTGNGAQEVVVYVSEDLRARIMPGMQATLGGAEKGMVSAIDPGLDPVTKRARVIIALSKGVTLTNGSFVDVTLTPKGGSTPPNKDEGFYVPITALKVLPTGLVVFTVRDGGTLEAHTVEEGTIVGDRMLIKTGLTTDMRIVTDARGLRADEKVRVP